MLLPVGECDRNASDRVIYLGLSASVGPFPTLAVVWQSRRKAVERLGPTTTIVEYGRDAQERGGALQFGAGTSQSKGLAMSCSMVSRHIRSRRGRRDGGQGSVKPKCDCDPDMPLQKQKEQHMTKNGMLKACVLLVAGLCNEVQA